MIELKWRNYPVPGMPDNITGGFGADYGYPHRGTDVGVVTGTPVYAPADGRSVSFTNDGSFGKAVCLEHPGTGWYSLYAHLDRVDVSLWGEVVAGQRIGVSGSTGMSSGPHLHWQVCDSTAFPVDISHSRDPMGVPFETEEDVMTPEQEKLLLLVASVVGGWTNGKQFDTVEEALPSFETFEAQDQRVIMGMGLLGESIEAVARVLQEHLDGCEPNRETYFLMNELLVNVRHNLVAFVESIDRT